MNLAKNLCFWAFSALFIAPGHTYLEKTTTIVVIDGKALLVDLNEEGEVLTTYMEVSGYFESTKDHNTKVLEAKATYSRLTKAQMDQIRFIALADEGWDLNQLMISNLADLASHYHQTYANQIEITVAQNEQNEYLITSNLESIQTILTSYGVKEKDILINYKTDLGDEPTQFVKVVSNLKRLTSS